MGEWEWIVKIDSQVNEMANTSVESPQWSKRSIYRIPVVVTDLDKKAYNYKPVMVSLGPYHHGAENLVAMEEHKHRALLHFLKRSKKPLKSYVDALIPVAQDLKDAYDQLDHKWEQDTEKFLQLMILDGCFILEMLRRTITTTNFTDDLNVPQHEQDPQTEYASNDPIFSYHGKLYFVPYLKRDMLMLENQVPMMVLQKLVANDTSFFKVRDSERGGGGHSQELTKLILEFFSRPSHVKNIHEFEKCLHILDVYRKSLLLEYPRNVKTKGDRAAAHYKRGDDEIIRSATDLIFAGIKIKPSRTRSLKDILFRGGVLRLPLIVVDDALEPLYLNLIAFERFHVGAGNYITSYIFFMDKLFNSARDVRLLNRCGIIQNALGSDEAVVNLFHSLSKDITLDPDSSLDEVHKLVSAYCHQSWHKWRANLIHTYLTIKVAAILLFALTALQTVYTVLAYVSPHGK